MSSVRYIDAGIRCDHDGCYAITYASQADVKDSAGLIRYLRKHGWSISIHRGRGAFDLCPAHSGRRTK